MKIVVACLILIIAFYGCKHGDASFRETKDGDMTIQLLKMDDPSKSETALSYKMRITPDKKLLEQKNDETKKALWYKMDSCFYLQDGEKRVYATLVQPVANGINGSFEYLLDFDIGTYKGDSLLMIYHDRYINQHIYTLKLNKD